jgi:RNA polymerase subunit RPABC4/transcription elongation factor Spt4
MSAVRMCDRCGTIFPETAEGWGVGTISTNAPRGDGRGQVMVEQRIDMCPTCNQAPTAHLTPKIAVPAALTDKTAPQQQPGAFPHTHVTPFHD